MVWVLCILCKHIELVVGVAANTSASMIKHNCLEAWPCMSLYLGLIFTCDFTCLTFVTEEAVRLPSPATSQKECPLVVEEPHIYKIYCNLGMVAYLCSAVIQGRRIAVKSRPVWASVETHFKAKPTPLYTKGRSIL